MRQLIDTADYLASRLDPARDRAFDEFAIADSLRRIGSWIVPAYAMAPHGDEIRILRVVVREDLSRERCDELIAHLNTVMHCLTGGGVSSSSEEDAGMNHY